MNRTALLRRTPLRARRWGIRARRPRRLDRPGADAARLAFCRLGPCAARWTLAGAGDCRGRMEACHEGRNGVAIRGLGLKVADEETLPMCSKHHREWTAHRGLFARWDRERRRTWADDQAAATHARYLSAGSRRGT